MRLVFTILFLISVCYGQSKYYVDNAGSDAANGLTTGTAWQTLAKINSSSFLSGDSIFLKRSGTWNERLIIPSSNIYIGAYGTGNNPLITAFQTVSSLTDSSNVWSASIPNSVADLNTVLVDGKIKARARYPNTGYLTFTSVDSKTQLTTSLTGTPNYSGSDVVVRSTAWIIDRVRVASQAGGVLTLRDELTYPTSYGGNGFFFQNLNSALDLYGEWTFDSTNKVIRVYSTSLPVVQISTIDTLVWVNNKDNVTFNGLSIIGANKAAFQIDTSRSISIINCSINNSGSLGISALKSPLLYIANDSIQNSLSGAIYARQVDPYTPTVNTCDSAIIINNYVKNTAPFSGMGMNNNGTYYAIYIVGLNTLISNNTVDSCSYVGISSVGKKGLIRNNVISNYCFLKNDGGGIYFGIGAYYPADYLDSTRVISNIIYNGIGSIDGTSLPAPLAQGIYLDDYTKLVTVDSNTVFNAADGIFLHNNYSNTIRNNILFNNYVSGFRLTPDINIPQNIVFKNNKIYSSISTPLFWMSNGISSPSNLGLIDSNYYSHPYDESKIVLWYSTDYTLSGWQSFSSKDLNSKGTSSLVTGATALLKYNTDTIPKAFSLSGIYIDITGIYYNNSITLQPFTSAILFKAISDILPKYNLIIRKISK